MNRDRLRFWLYPLLGFLLFAFSLYILKQEIGKYSLDDILTSLDAIGDRQLLTALGFTALGYCVISSYDLIAFLQLKYYLNVRRILLTSFLTYAVSNTTGFTLLIGGGIRYRFYSAWGVPNHKIAKIIALGNLTFWLGTITLAGITLITNSLEFPERFTVNIFFLRCLGIVALVAIALYLYFCKRRKYLNIGGKKICFPRISTSICQILLFTLDWVCAAAVLYALTPDYPAKSYGSFFSIYLLAMTASIVSNIPGGIGIFETIIIFLLPQTIPVNDILGSLLAYRVIRFLLPLATALVFLAGFELRQRFKSVKQQK